MHVFCEVLQDLDKNIKNTVCIFLPQWHCLLFIRWLYESKLSRHRINNRQQHVVLPRKYKREKT